MMRVAPPVQFIWWPAITQERRASSWANDTYHTNTTIPTVVQLFYRKVRAPSRRDRLLPPVLVVLVVDWMSGTLIL
jgi:hypothetical protein